MRLELQSKRRLRSERSNQRRREILYMVPQVGWRSSDRDLQGAVRGPEAGVCQELQIIPAFDLIGRLTRYAADGARVGRAPRLMPGR